MTNPDYPDVEGLPEATEIQCYEVYVDSGRADDLFRAFCRSLGGSCEVSWKDSYDV